MRAINTRSSITENTTNVDKNKNSLTTTSALQKRVPFSDISNASAFQRPTIQHTKKSALAQPALKQQVQTQAVQRPLAVVNKAQQSIRPAIIKPAARPLSAQEVQPARIQSRPHSLHAVPTSSTLSLSVETHSIETGMTQSILLDYDMFLPLRWQKENTLHISYEFKTNKEKKI